MAPKKPEKKLRKEEKVKKAITIKKKKEIVQKYESGVRVIDLANMYSMSTGMPGLYRMNSASPSSRELRFLPSMYSTLPHFPAPSKGSHHLPGSSVTHSSWEMRCMRKHRRRTEDEGCSAKRQKLMEDAGSDPSEYTCPKPGHGWLAACTAAATPSLSIQICPAPVQPCPEPQVETLPTARVEPEGFCMEVEAAQRRLQEIEDRITLEDDSDEDLDVELAQRRPVLVLSDSLREGLQRGIGDILPHTVAQSVSRSCMELVLWRPPEDPLTQQLKDSLQRQQRKQQPVGRQTPTPIPSPSIPLSKGPDKEAFRPIYCPPDASSMTEEDMEL